RRMRRYATALAVTALLLAGGFAAASIASGGGLASVSTTGTTSTTSHKQTLCHHTHSKKHPFHTISVDSHAVPAHLKHGDTLAAWGTLQYGFYTHRLLLDTPVYERYGDRILDGKLPYRDFTLEYPPGALPVFAAPSAAVGRHRFHAYTKVFEGLMGICGALAVAAAAAVLVRQRASDRRLTASL